MTAITKSQAMLIQRALRETVEPTLKVDGSLGAVSLAALQKLASVLGMQVPEGYEGDVFRTLLIYIEQRFVSEEAFTQAANELGVDEACVRSIAEVESSRAGFLADGRLTILFERHWFYRKMREALAFRSSQDHVLEALRVSMPASESDRAAKILALLASKEPAICNSISGGYMGGAAEWPRLERASRYDVEAAYEAASYGSFQIMGFNHESCGYENAREMVISFAKSESNQFIGLCRFIRANKALLAALKTKNWAVFAKGYNGPEYAKNNYDTKLQKAYAKWTAELKK